MPEGSIAWTGRVRGSLGRLGDEDGRFLEKELIAQSASGLTYPLDEQDLRKLKTHTVTRTDKVVAVSVPDDTALVEKVEAPPEIESRESIQIQALIASIGAQMGRPSGFPVLIEGLYLENGTIARIV